ncbi:golgin subfamily A member 6-like protein 6 isoform X2 [Artemia franciscana]
MVPSEVDGVTCCLCHISLPPVQRWGMWSITEIYGIPVVKFDEEVGGFYRVQTENKFTTFPGYELFETLAVRVTKKHIKNGNKFYGCKTCMESKRWNPVNIIEDFWDHIHSGAVLDNNLPLKKIHIDQNKMNGDSISQAIYEEALGQREKDLWVLESRLKDRETGAPWSVDAGTDYGAVRYEALDQREKALRDKEQELLEREKRLGALNGDDSGLEKRLKDIIDSEKELSVLRSDLMQKVNQHERAAGELRELSEKLKMRELELKKRDEDLTVRTVELNNRESKLKDIRGPMQEPDCSLEFLKAHEAELANTIASLQESLNKTEGLEAQCRREIMEKDNMLTSLSIQVKDFESQLRVERKIRSDLELEKIHFEEKQRSFGEALNELNNIKEQLEIYRAKVAEMNSASDKASELNNQLLAKDKEIESNKKMCHELAAKVTELEESLVRIKSLTVDSRVIDELKGQISAKDNEIVSVAKELEKAKQEAKNQSLNDLSVLKNELETKRNDIWSLENKLVQQEGDIKELQAKISELKAERKELIAVNQELNCRVTNENEGNSLKNELQVKEEKIKYLESLMKQQEDKMRELQVNSDSNLNRLKEELKNMEQELISKAANEADACTLRTELQARDEVVRTLQDKLKEQEVDSEELRANANELSTLRDVLKAKNVEISEQCGIVDQLKKAEDQHNQELSDLRNKLATFEELKMELEAKDVEIQELKAFAGQKVQVESLQHSSPSNDMKELEKKPNHENTRLDQGMNDYQKKLADLTREREAFIKTELSHKRKEETLHLRELNVKEKEESLKKIEEEANQILRQKESLEALEASIVKQKEEMKKREEAWKKEQKDIEKARESHKAFEENVKERERKIKESENLIKEQKEEQKKHQRALQQQEKEYKQLRDNAKKLEDKLNKEKSELKKEVEAWKKETEEQQKKILEKTRILESKVRQERTMEANRRVADEQARLNRTLVYIAFAVSLLANLYWIFPRSQN